MSLATNPTAPYLFIASMDVDAEHERVFHEVYDGEHIPHIAKVPGVLSIRRYRLLPLTLRVGGELTHPSLDGEPRFSAVYELRNADVLKSPAWEEAVERGRWPAEVRPHTRLRRHRLLEPLGPAPQAGPTASRA